MSEKKVIPVLEVGSTVNYWPSPVSEEDDAIRSIAKEGKAIEATVSKIHFQYKDIDGALLSASVNITLNGDDTRETVTFAKQEGCSRSFTFPKTEE